MRTEEKKETSWNFLSGVIVVLVFYVLGALLGGLGMFYSPIGNLTFPLMERVRLLSYMTQATQDKRPLYLPLLHVVSRLYTSDGEIQHIVGKQMDLHGADAGPYVRRALTAAPTNQVYWRHGLGYAIKKQDTHYFIALVQTDLRNELGPQYRDLIDRLSALYFLPFSHGTQYSQLLFDPSEKKRDRYAKFFYAVGDASLNRDPENAALMWDSARLLLPEWSYFHIELASLYSHVLGDSVKARAILQECLQHKWAKQHCRSILADGIPAVGSLKENIFAIPRILP